MVQNQYNTEFFLKGTNSDIYSKTECLQNPFLEFSSRMKCYRGEGLLFLITCFKLGRCCNLSRTTTTTTHERFIVVLLSLSQVSTNFLSLQKIND